MFRLFAAYGDPIYEAPYNGRDLPDYHTYIFFGGIALILLIALITTIAVYKANKKAATRGKKK